MAKTGLSDYRYAILTEAADGTPSYGTVKTPAKAVSCQVNITNNSAKLYANNVLAESDTSFQSGTITAEFDDDNDATLAELLGHTITNGEIVRSSTDAAPYVGFGRVISKMVNGARKYKVEFLYKVKFAEPSQDNTTQGEALEFGTTSVEGEIATLKNGKWSVAYTADSYNEAVSYLEGLFADLSFTIGSTTYHASTGMSWRDWTNSTYNTLGVVEDGTTLVFIDASGTTPVVKKITYSSTDVTPTELIVDGRHYLISAVA